MLVDIFSPKIAPNKRPDLVLWSSLLKTVYIRELTVPWEDSVEKTYECRKLRYAKLSTEAKQRLGTSTSIQLKWDAEDLYLFYYQATERATKSQTGAVSDNQITLSGGWKKQPVDMAQVEGPLLGQEDRTGGQFWDTRIPRWALWRHSGLINGTLKTEGAHLRTSTSQLSATLNQQGESQVSAYHLLVQGIMLTLHSVFYGSNSLNKLPIKKKLYHKTKETTRW